MTRGAISTPGSLLRLYLEEMHRAPWDEGARMAAVRGVRLVTLSIWLLGSLVLLYFLGSPFARAAARAEDDWTGTLLAGALGVLTLFLAATAALALLPAALSLPIALTFGAVAVVGLVADAFLRRGDAGPIAAELVGQNENRHITALKTLSLIVNAQKLGAFQQPSFLRKTKA